MNNKGIFITFEGADGSGKSTMIHYVYDMLSKNDEYKNKIVLTREPGGTKLAEKIRNIILDNENTDIDPMTELLLFLAARRQHLKEVIIPALNNGKIVLCDRYIDSSFIYQGFKHNISLETIEKLSSLMTNSQINIFPDYTLLFQINAETSLERMKQRNDKNRLDSNTVIEAENTIKFYNKIVKKYKKIRNFILIDANKSIENVEKQCEEVIINIIEEKNNLTKYLLKKDFITVNPNKYNLNLKDLNNFVLIDENKLLKEIHPWLNKSTNMYCWTKSIGTSDDIKYCTNNHIFIGFHDDGTIEVNLSSYGGMAGYDFTNFFDKNDIENKNDYQTQIELLKIFNKMIDLKIIEKK